MEWSKVGDCRKHAGMGKKYDLESVQPMVNPSKTVYPKGISLSNAAMQAIEARLESNPILPKWDILIRPG